MIAHDATAGDPRRWMALPILLLGAFLPIFDFNVVNLALPSIRSGLGATSGEVQFVVSAYAATYAVFLITGGRLGDWLGRRRMFMLGVAGFTTASLACAVAQTPGMLIAGRILQGFTATIMAPQVLASIRVMFPQSEQGKALAFYSATFGLANVLGQICGGLLVSVHPWGLTWQTIFFVNVPLGFIAFAGAKTFLAESRAERAQRLDLEGVALLSLALGLMVYPLVQGREDGWPWWSVAMLAAVPLLLGVFARFERALAARGGSPLVDMSLLGKNGVALGMLIALLYYMLSAFYLTYSVYLQGGLGLGPVQAGLQTVPFGIGYSAAAIGSARLMQRFGPRALTLGLSVQMLGFGALTWLVAGHAFELVPATLAVAGFGFGIVMPAVISTVVGAVETKFAGLASGVLISTFQIGAALGVAVVGGVFFSVLGSARDVASYAWAFRVGLACNIGLLGIGALLSLWLPQPRMT